MDKKNDDLDTGPKKPNKYIYISTEKRERGRDKDNEIYIYKEKGEKGEVPSLLMHA